MDDGSAPAWKANRLLPMVSFCIRAQQNRAGPIPVGIMLQHTLIYGTDVSGLMVGDGNTQCRERRFIRWRWGTGNLASAYRWRGKQSRRTGLIGGGGRQYDRSHLRRTRWRWGQAITRSGRRRAMGECNVALGCGADASGTWGFGGDV